MSEKVQHTPGPWELDPDGRRIWAEVPIWQHPREYGRHCILGTDGPDSVAMPNARLIAAAPELLAALERIVNGINDEWHPLFHNGQPMTDDEREALERAETAIAKARGDA